jgi:hypothetical protein
MCPYLSDCNSRQLQIAIETHLAFGTGSEITGMSPDLADLQPAGTESNAVVFRKRWVR